MIKVHQIETALDEVELAVVIVNYATPELTMRSVAALAGARSSLPNLKAIVVDGGSPDNSADLLCQGVAAACYRDWVTFLPLPLNGGFGWANNQALLVISRQVRIPEFIYFLNPDAEVCPGAVAALVEELKTHPKCAAAGSQLLSSQRKETASAFRFPSVGRELVGAAQSQMIGSLLGIPKAVVSSNQSIEVDWVTGASFIVRREAFEDSGLFDDGFFLYFEEVELMHRLRSRGWSIRYVPESRVVHIEGAATGMAARTLHAPYWYHSRRRYFGLTGGRMAVFGAGVAALVGHALAKTKQCFGRTTYNTAFRARDLIRFGLLPRAADLRPSFPKWADVEGKLPAWMTA